MQLIAEAYDVLKTLGGSRNAELADTFAEWNAGELQSFLIEITANIFRKKDPETGNDLVDMIVDAAAARRAPASGRCRTPPRSASPVPTIASSVEARLISADRAERVAASKLLAGPTGPKRRSGVDKKKLIADVRAALYVGEGLQLRAGHEPPPRRLERPRVGPQPRRARAHLEGRLHHPRAVPRPHQGGLRPRREPREPAARPRLPQGARRAAGRLAAHGRAGDQRRLPAHDDGRRRSATTTRSAASACPRTSRRPSATTSVRTPTSASTSPARSTRSGRRSKKSSATRAPRPLDVSWAPHFCGFIGNRWPTLRTRPS